MGQSSSRPTTSPRGNNRNPKYEHTGPYEYPDDDLSKAHSSPKQQRLPVSHRAKANTKSTSSHHKTISRHTTQVVNHTAQRAPASLKTSSHQNSTTRDKRYHHDEAHSSSRRDDKTSKSIHSKSRSQYSHSGSRHRKPQPKKECVVCMESRSLSRFRLEPPTTRCSHDIDVCGRCLRRWIRTSFSSKAWDDINCPTCAERLTIEDVQKFASGKIYRKYKKLHVKAELEAMPGFYWCITKGCRSGQTIAPGTGKFKCVCCKQTHCMEHNVAWHKGESCEQYESRRKKKAHRKEEVASKKYLSEQAKCCPGCKRHIEKVNGCDHMTCTKCKSEFCWECLATYKRPRDMNSVVHRVECPHYSPRISSPPVYAW